MELPILKDIVIILGFSVVIILLFQKLKLPEILGFLLTGVITGPHGLNIINASHEVELLSEIGIIFLLFVIVFTKNNPSKHKFYFLLTIKMSCHLQWSYCFFLTYNVYDLRSI